MAHQLANLLPPPHHVAVALHELLDDPMWERRTERRLPYFGPAALWVPPAVDIRQPVFVRDISIGGIGLVHLMPIKRGDVVLTLHVPSGRELSLWTEMLWCRDYGDGWYASGGHFVDLF